jgi:hypothetical protein
MNDFDDVIGQVVRSDFLGQEPEQVVAASSEMMLFDPMQNALAVNDLVRGVQIGNKNGVRMRVFSSPNVINRPAVFDPDRSQFKFHKYLCALPRP